MKQCSRCNQKPHEDWPDDQDGMLCQECWESHSELFWQVMNKCWALYPYEEETE